MCLCKYLSTAYAMQDFHSVLCVCFLAYSVSIVDGRSSRVGNRGGTQRMCLLDTC